MVCKTRPLTMVLFILVILGLTIGGVSGLAATDKLNLALVWHQHQPLYKDTAAEKYKLPWARVHAVQEYYDSPYILNNYGDIHVTYNLVPSLIDQIHDYARISDQERSKGGLYNYIGAVDPHLRLAFTPVSKLTKAERHRITQEFFWLNQYMLDDDGDDPYYSPRYADLQQIANQRALTDQELTDLKALFFLWQISPILQEQYGLTDLRGKVHYSQQAIRRLINVQRKICSKVLAQYKQALRNGSEIMTSPYYHPILPLLMSDGWEGVNKERWVEDTMAQLENAQSQYKRIFDHKPAGLWPPEQAVSEQIIAPVGRAGFKWTISDQGVLADSLGHSPSINELTQPYIVKNSGQQLYMFFRHSTLSDNISLSYGNKSTTYAVNDFMSELKKIKNRINDPSQQLLTVAMDGENWMFMAGYPNNGRSFLRELYARIQQADWVHTVTPNQFIQHYNSEPTALPKLATGSWAGDLSTWRGESEETQAWRRLIDARNRVVSKEAGPTAWKAIYSAEGSDWFWWYGSDQTSGNDPLFDELFKTHLINAYQAAGVNRDKIPAELFVNKIQPITQALGQVKPVIDGKVTDEKEWRGAIQYPVTGSSPITQYRVGYGPNKVYVRVDTRGPASKLIGNDLTVSLYFSGSGPSNARTRFGQKKLGFALQQMVALHLGDVKENGAWKVFRYIADGNGGWSFGSSITTLSRRNAKVGEVIEFAFPYKTINIEPEENMLMRFVVERTQEKQHVIAAPDSPVRTKIPKPVSGNLVFRASDPHGDDYGPGSYTYPEAPVFNKKGLFDLLRYEIYDAGEKWQFVFDFAAMTNPWSAPLGFSHQLIDLYLDTKPGGKVVTHKPSAQVKFSSDHQWDYFLKIAGWPGYGKELVTAEGDKRKIEVSSNVNKKRVIVGVSKQLLPTIQGGHYVLVFSQDGYGKDHIRSLQRQASTWNGGGCPAPAVAPKAYDYLAPDQNQKAILSGYNVEQDQFAVLEPIIVEQQ